MKVQVLLALRGDQSPGMLEAQLASEGQRIRGRLPAGGGYHRRSFRLAADPLAATGHGDAISGGLDALVEASLPDGADPEALVHAVDGLAGRLERWVDPIRSAAIAGTEHVVVPGEAPLLLVYALRRLPGLSAAQFSDHWIGVHAEFGRRVKGLRGYRQVHADRELTAAAARAAGVAIDDYDGVAEAYYDDVDHFLAILNSPEVGTEAMEDEKRFIDHARSAAALTRVAYAVRD